MSGWPDTRKETPIEIRKYWDSRDQLTVSDGIIFKGMRIVIPPALRKDMLKLVHRSHLGIVKCKQRAREAMYWPGMNTDIEAVVKDCSNCAENQNQQQSQPLMPTPTPDLPYEMVGCDIFQFETKKYVLTVDYYSKFIDVSELTDESTTAVISALKIIFSCHGIPQRLRTDNGPQFSSVEFKEFCKLFQINHETSSPHFQSSNGEAERAIQTVKKLWKKNDDKHISLLDYRTTPLPDINLSPAQLLMGRRPRNILPTSYELLKPQGHSAQTVKRHFNREKQAQKYYYDKRKGVKDLHPLQERTQVRITDGTKTKWFPGEVVAKYDKPRSYIVQSENGRLYRRNRKHLRVATQAANKTWKSSDDPPVADVPDVSPPEPIPSAREAPSAPIEPQRRSNTMPYVTRSGRTVNKPKILDL
jgi:hypothetical protein